MKNSINKNVKYVHDAIVHNMSAPSIVVPIVLDTLKENVPSIQVESVVDFGCGTGTWLHAFKNSGIKEVHGLDGSWYNPNLLFEHITENEFQCVDLEKQITLDKQYDLAMSLEVAEHVSAEHADDFVQSLVNAGKIILFSAAIPGQGGFNHINEQWPSYWVEKFKKHGYIFHDVLRGKLWRNYYIDIHYRQNIFIVVHESIETKFQGAETIYDIVHPYLFLHTWRGGMWFHFTQIFKVFARKVLHIHFRSNMKDFYFSHYLNDR